MSLGRDLSSWGDALGGDLVKDQEAELFGILASAGIIIVIDQNCASWLDKPGHVAAAIGVLKPWAIGERAQVE